MSKQWASCSGKTQQSRKSQAAAEFVTSLCFSQTFPPPRALLYLVLTSHSGPRGRFWWRLPYLLDNIGEIACHFRYRAQCSNPKRRCSIFVASSTFFDLGVGSQNMHISHFSLQSAVATLFITFVPNKSTHRHQKMRAAILLTLLGVLSVVKFSTAEESDEKHRGLGYRPSNSWSRPSGGWNSKVSKLWLLFPYLHCLSTW